MANKYKLLILYILVIFAFFSYLLYGLRINITQLTVDTFALKLRLISLGGIVVTATAIAVATMAFHAIANNRIVTPSMLGLDDLYILGKTIIIFTFGTKALLSTSVLFQFIFAVTIMVLYALALYKLFFSGARQNIFFLLLVGFLFATLFNASTTFLSVALDPSEFQIAQDIRFVGFNSINGQVLAVASVLVVVIVAYVYTKTNILDVLSLGRDQAINLGIAYDKQCRTVMILVAFLIALATAVVGPLLFLGLMILNLSIQLFKTYQHKVLMTGAILLSILVLLIGQFIVAHILNYKTELNVIINFVGGVYFIWILLAENRKWQ